MVNTAARLQAAAPTDGILVDEATVRATDRQITYRSAEAVAAKGKSAPVPAWQVVQARASLGVDVSQVPRTALVGREGELQLLRAALERTRTKQAPQLVTLIGVPGIGKSRLVYELLQTVKAEPELTLWRQGRCLPYGEGVALWALGELVKAQAGILETDPAHEADAKLIQAVADVIGDQAEAAWVHGHLRALIGIAGAEAGVDRRVEAFAAWRRFCEALAEQSPAVLVVEDLHWADELLLDFLDQLVDWAADVPLLVVATARPELLSRRPGWGGGKPNSSTVTLAPLSEPDTARLVGELLGRALLPAETQAALLVRAGGNPLYAEEYVRMLADRGFLRKVGAAGGWTAPSSCLCRRPCRASSPPAWTLCRRRTRRCWPTPRCSARSAGWAPWQPSVTASRSSWSSGCMPWSVRSSCAGSDAARSPGSASTPSVMCWSATWPISSCHEPLGPTGTGGQPSGCRHCPRIGPRTAPNCSLTIGGQRWSSLEPQARTPRA